MISLTIIFSILICHWIADCVLQTHWQATNKSKNNEALLQHTCVYSVVMSVAMIFIMPISEYGCASLIFLPITFICHTITDYFTSRLNTWLLNKKDYHNFFVSVGFDQILHYVQLFLTYYYLTK